MKKFLLLICTVLLLGGCVEIERQAFRDSYLMYLIDKQKGEPKTVSVTGVSLDKTTLSVDVSGHFLLTATVLPENADNKAVSWESSNPAVATVDSEGNVSGISDGTATITVTTQDGSKTAVCEVTVGNNVEVEDNPDQTTISISSTDSSEPKSAAGTIPVEEGFVESKETVIEVSGVGTVTFDADATAKILANAQADGATSVFFKVADVTEEANVPEDFDIVYEVTMKTLDENGTEVYNEHNAEGVVTIEIPLESDVVYVNSVTLVDANGEPLTGGVVPDSIVFDEENHTLTFQVYHFSKYAVDFITKDENVSVTGVSLELEEITITVGDPDMKLTATVAPKYATDKTVSWSSDNTDVATVDREGNVHAVADGTATITVTTTDGGFTASCTVTVKAPLPEGALNGAFTVNAEGKKVFFSQGNMYYDGSSFQFETNQYDTLKTVSKEHLSYFYWSKSASIAIADSYNDTPKSDDILFTNATATTPNPVFVVNGEKGIYRSLSDSELSYILYSRPNAARKVGFATVNDVTGVILLPDSFTDPNTNAGNTGNSAFIPKSDTPKWIDNIYSADSWAAMESAGAVFLPATGYKSYDGSYDVDDDMIYWLSNQFSAGQGRILYVKNNNGVVSRFEINNFGTKYGFLIRLVTDGNPANVEGMGFEYYDKGGILK